MNAAVNIDTFPVEPEFQGGAERQEAESPTVRNDARAEVTASPSHPNADAHVPAIRLPVDASGLSLGILATVAVVFVLDWAQSFIISLLLGILFAYTLNPLVVWLERIRLPRVICASTVMVTVVSTLLLGSYALRGEVQAILAQLPETATRLSTELASIGAGQRINMQKMRAAATEVEKATNRVAGISPGKSATHVVIDQPAFKLGGVLWVGSKGVLGVVGQTAMVIFLVYFLLLAADTFKRKLVRLAGPTMSRRKITVHILDDINNSIQRYMFMLLLTNVLVALLSWVAFRWIGLENAGAWAVAAGLLHVIPYFGPAFTAAVTGMAALLQFNGFSMVLLVAGSSLAIAVLVGTLITTWMTGRIARMNTAAVFISLLFWGWLWGIWGMLLSIPIIVIMKVVSQHVEQLQPVAELLGE